MFCDHTSLFCELPDFKSYLYIWNVFLFINCKRFITPSFPLELSFFRYNILNINSTEYVLYTYYSQKYI